MQHISRKVVEALRTLVRDARGDWAAALSEISNFEHSDEYRQGLANEFERKRHRKPTDAELMKFFIQFVMRRCKLYRDWYS